MWFRRRHKTSVVKLQRDVDVLVEALRLTVEYVGNDTLPALEGWAWFEALQRVRPDVAQRFVERPVLSDRADDGNLVRHARRELEAARVELDVSESVIRMVREFSAQGHSGMSAAITRDIIYKLLNFENLAPLTSHPCEWNYVGDNTWQNARNSEAFSHNNGKTYRLLSERRRWVPFWARRIPLGWRIYQGPVHVSEPARD